MDLYVSSFFFNFRRVIIILKVILENCEINVNKKKIWYFSVENGKKTKIERDG